MYVNKRLIARYTRPLLFLAPAVALASPAFAQYLDPRLADQSEPGSVIVFPKYVRGTVSVDGAPVEKTEIEVGVVCPNGQTPTPDMADPPLFCAEHTPVKIRFHWVCPSDQAFENKFICKENDFDVVTSINGKVVFNPDGTVI